MKTFDCGHRPVCDKHVCFVIDMVIVVVVIIVIFMVIVISIGIVIVIVIDMFRMLKKTFESGQWPVCEERVCDC